ncbi:hypothetical protein ABIA39_008983 [Nocardia sp. GAS34]|uniref:hypothetical protein n=1 Tax=unclassified Nocardia TaxID=2637762 RepID=UPI003D2504FB
MAQPQGLGPDFLREVMPPQIRERLGVMQAWSNRMVLAYMGRQPESLADYAQRISVYDDDPTVAGGRFTGKFPGTRYTFAVSRAGDLFATMLDAARLHHHFTNAEVTAGVRALVTDLVPDDHRAEALTVLDRQPTTGEFGQWEINDAVAGLGELYVVTAVAAWFASHRMVSPSAEAARRIILKMTHDAEAMAWGVPEAERLDVTEEQALELLDSLLGTTDPDFNFPGVPPGQSGISRDRNERTLVEMEVVEAAKAHIIEHPIRTRETDIIMLEAMSRAMDNSAARDDGLTESERRRAANLAAREARRNSGEAPAKGKKRKKGR